jgi:hypothetical protein
MTPGRACDDRAVNPKAWRAQAEALAIARTRGDITDDEWFVGMAAIFENAYLEATNPRGQSGFGGDEERWEIARRPIASMIDAPGSLLDIGCANGYLMECLARWSDHEIEPYGLDIASAVVALARRRLPEWKDRFFIGNALTWEPPGRFDFARTELVYVPEHLQRPLVERLLEDAVQPHGRLIICGYGSPRSGLAAHPVRRLVRDFGFEPDAELTVDAPEGGGAIAEIVALRRMTPESRCCVWCYAQIVSQVPVIRCVPNVRCSAPSRAANPPTQSFCLHAYGRISRNLESYLSKIAC